MAVREQVIYFEDKSDFEANTQQVVAQVSEYVRAHPEVQYVVAASSTGFTAAQFALADLASAKLVAVKMSQAVDAIYGVKLDQQHTRLLQEKGVPLVMGTHVLTGGVDHALVDKFRALPPTTLIASVLYLFSQGMKVCLEIVAMAVDAGQVPEGIEAIAVAGTDQGCDTAVVLRTASSTHFFDMDVRKVLAMPIEK